MIEVSIDLVATDFPDPVEPQHKICGIEFGFQYTIFFSKRLAYGNSEFFFVLF